MIYSLGFSVASLTRPDPRPVGADCMRRSLMARGDLSGATPWRPRLVGDVVFHWHKVTGGTAGSGRLVRHQRAARRRSGWD